MKRLVTLPLVLLTLAVMACESPVETAPDAQRPFTVSTMQDNTQFGDPQVGTSAIFPSTNLINSANGWTHVEWVPQAVVVPEQVTLRFTNPRGFLGCFEIRIDDEPPLEGVTNPNENVPNVWDSRCLNNDTFEETFNAASHVDIRSSFGAEGDERFDWTRFYVLSLENKDQCKAGQWEALGFANQGQCVRYVETGKDSRTGG